MVGIRVNRLDTVLLIKTGCIFKYGGYFVSIQHWRYLRVHNFEIS